MIMIKEQANINRQQGVEMVRIHEQNEQLESKVRELDAQNQGLETRVKELEAETQKQYARIEQQTEVIGICHSGIL